LSILTKIFIILLTLASLFLCGFVIKYIATSENFKELYSQETKNVTKFKSERNNLDTQLKEEIVKEQTLADSKNAEIKTLNDQINVIKDSLDKINQEKSALQDQIGKLQSQNATMADASKIQTAIAESASKEVVKLQSDLTTEKKKYDEAAAALLQKDSQIDTLTNDSKRLLEQKVALEQKLTKILQPYGQKPSAGTPVTQEKGPAQPVISTPANAAQISLQAKLTAVDMKNNLAKLSIGQADGVKLGMRFHISRDGQYICDIRVIDVAAEEAIGTMELVQQEPRAGDNAATNL
jgi:DNA repair exonuclease SbcCD ATPase subunit